jgi:hypothetical protein
MTVEDRQLLEAWYADRGSRVKRLPAHQETRFLPALRARHEEQQTPKPLEYCATCKVMTRGEHHPTPEAAA